MKELVTLLEETEDDYQLRNKIILKYGYTYYQHLEELINEKTNEVC